MTYSIKKTPHNSTYPKGGVSCSKDSFVVNQTLIFQIKFCGKSPALRVAAKRSLPPIKQSKMEKKLITLFFTFSCLSIYGQSTNYGIQVNSGFFRFTGESAEKTEQINYSLDKEDGYTNNPYGNKYGLSYGISANITRTTKANLRLGIDFGYEVLRSRINIKAVRQYSDNINETVSAIGKTNLNSSFLSFFPSIGYQISNSFFNIFLDGGVDFGYCINSIEKGHANSETREYETYRDRKTLELDVRPLIQIGIQKHKVGGYIGYSVSVRASALCFRFRWEQHLKIL